MYRPKVDERKARYGYGYWYGTQPGRADGRWRWSSSRQSSNESSSESIPYLCKASKQASPQEKKQRQQVVRQVLFFPPRSWTGPAPCWYAKKASRRRRRASGQVEAVRKGRRTFTPTASKSGMELGACQREWPWTGRHVDRVSACSLAVWRCWGYPFAVQACSRDRDGKRAVQRRGLETYIRQREAAEIGVSACVRCVRRCAWYVCVCAMSGCLAQTSGGRCSSHVMRACPGAAWGPDR